MVMLKSTLMSADPVYNAAPAQIWALAEVFLGLFAANIPPLKGLLEHVLRVVSGRDTTKQASSRVNTYGTPEDYELSRDLQLTKDQAEVSYHSAIRSIHRPRDSIGNRSSETSSEHDLINSARPQSSHVCYIKTEYEVKYEPR